MVCHPNGSGGAAFYSSCCTISRSMSVETSVPRWFSAIDLDDIAFCCEKRDLGDAGEMGIDGDGPGVERPFGDVTVVAVFHAPGAEFMR